MRATLPHPGLGCTRRVTAAVRLSLRGHWRRGTMKEARRGFAELLMTASAVGRFFVRDYALSGGCIPAAPQLLLCRDQATKLASRYPRVRSKRARHLFRPYRGLIRGAGNPHRVARRNRFLRAVDKPVRKGHSGRDLDIIAEIAAKLNFAQHDLVFFVNLGHLHSMRAEDQGRGRHPQHIWIRRNVKMHRRKSPRP